MPATYPRTGNKRYRKGFRKDIVRNLRESERMKVEAQGGTIVQNCFSYAEASMLAARLNEGEERYAEKMGFSEPAYFYSAVDNHPPFVASFFNYNSRGHFTNIHDFTIELPKFESQRKFEFEIRVEDNNLSSFMERVMPEPTYERKETFGERLLKMDPDMRHLTQTRLKTPEEEYLKDELPKTPASKGSKYMDRHGPLLLRVDASGHKDGKAPLHINWDLYTVKEGLLKRLFPNFCKDEHYKEIKFPKKKNSST